MDTASAKAIAMTVVRTVFSFVVMPRNPAIASAPRRRQFQEEGRSAPAGAREAHPAAVGLDHRTGEGEAETAAGDTARGGVATEELREDAVLLLVRDAAAVVAHRHPHRPVRAHADHLD